MKDKEHSIIKQVQSFWNQNVCGAKFVKKPFGTMEFFENVSNFRYTTEWHLNELVSFSEFCDKKVLEVGCGMGCDGRRFARSGAIYTGIDITDAAVQTSKVHFKLFKIAGQFYKMNAENLSFSDKTFDLVYSHGVLHHTDNISAAVEEIFRVLKPSGVMIMMLYHKASLNYYIRIMTVMRLAVLLYILVRPILPQKLRSSVLEQHYINYLHIGGHYFSPKEFVNHATDGPQCPVARAYNKEEARKLFHQFRNLRFRIAHFPLRKYVRFIPLWIERLFARRFGWYLFIYGNKRK